MMHLFSPRSTRAELMDGPGVSSAVYAECLADLAQINRVTWTHGPTLRWLDRALRRVALSTPISILDVAYGQGDLLRALHRWGTARGRELRLAGIDLNPRSAQLARAATPAGMQIDYRTGDVFTTPMSEPADFIVSSQFTHHLTNSEVVDFVRWMDSHCNRGWYVSDLHRHPVPYYIFPLMCAVARWHPIVRHDGTVSIARSFTLREWRALLHEAGVEATVRWHAPFFRVGVERQK